MSEVQAKLLLGDCREILKTLKDNSVDLIFTSPPYADSRANTYGGINPDHYVEWFLPVSKELLRVLKPTGTFVLNIKEKVVNGERHTYVIELILEMRKQGDEPAFYCAKCLARKEVQAMCKKAIAIIGTVMVMGSILVIIFPGMTNADSSSSPTQLMFGEVLSKLESNILPAWSQKLPAAKRFVLVLDSEAVLDRETGLVWEKSVSALPSNWSTLL